MAVKDFRELRVYVAAFEAAMRIFDLARGWPRDERHGLIDQVRRSSRAVCANVGEAWRKRRYPASFVNKLSDADAEAAETIVWLDLAMPCGYLGANEHADLRGRYERACAQLTKMMQQADRWCSAGTKEAVRLSAPRSALCAPRHPRETP